jgi:hypothetical protein
VVLYRSFKKSARVTKSALAAEIMTASEACDEGHWVRHILEQLLGLTLFTLPLSVTTDSESLSAASKITNNIQDKRSRIEVAQPREGLEMNKLELLWVPGGKQVADLLTKEVSSNQVERIKQGKLKESTKLTRISTVNISTNKVCVKTNFIIV